MNGNLTISLDQKSYNDVMKRLGSLEKVDQRTAIKTGLKEGASIIIAQGKVNLAARNKVRKGNLKRSFKDKIQLRKDSKKIYAGFRRPKGAAAHLVDKGTAERYTKSGAYRGKIIGSMFWSDAVHTKGDEAMDRLLRTVQNEITRIMYNL